MPKFDLAKTQEVQDLFAVEREKRDPDWIARLYSAIPDASMATTPDQVIQGPDGFPYFVLNLPPARQAFEPFCISHMLDECLKNGFGVVVQPEPHPPQWVFTYGLLWSLKEFGKFTVDQEPEGAAQDDVAPAPSLDGRTVLTGQPSASFFPAYARNVIKEFLKKEAGISTPEALLVNDPSGTPSQSLAFNVFQEDFEDQQKFENVMYRLTWFLPRHYGLISMAKDSDVAKGLQSL
jgi:hypothetical protein